MQGAVKPRFCETVYEFGKQNKLGLSLPTPRIFCKICKFYTVASSHWYIYKGARWCSSYSSRLQPEAASSNLGPGASCWKVGSYLPMPGGLQCSMHWFPPPVNYPSQLI